LDLQGAIPYSQATPIPTPQIHPPAYTVFERNNYSDNNMRIIYKKIPK
jgi:hypothetical protein